MRIVDDAVQTTKIGAARTFTVPPIDLSPHPLTVEQLHRFAQGGIIEITDEHRGFQAGQKVVDVLTFVRLK